MLLLGKSVKGRQPVTVEQKRVIIKVRHQDKKEEELDQEQQLMKLKREMLKNAQMDESKIAHFNRMKILTHWRKVMRVSKTDSLKKEIQIYQQNHDREVDAKDAILQMLDRDLEEAEEQYQMALRNHLIHVDELIALQESRLRGLHEQFELDLNILKEEFDREKQEILRNHDIEKKELQDMIDTVEEEQNNKLKDLKEAFESERENTKNTNTDALNSIKIELVKKINELDQDFELHFTRYVSETESKYNSFKKLLQENENASNIIDKKVRNIERLKEKIQYWRLKIQQNAKECDARNESLRKEKENISKHYQDLKNKMIQFREDESKRLGNLTMNSKSCMDTLNDYQKLAEKILKNAELCRKLETEKEKVMPFYQNDPESLEQAPEEESIKIAGVSKDKQNEFTLLDYFYKRYNKVLLDKLAIQKQKATLEKENMFFKSLLKQYLDGVSVNDDVMNSNNPLFVVNNKVNLNRPPVDRMEGAQSKTVVEAAFVVQSKALQNRYK